MVLSVLNLLAVLVAQAQPKNPAGLRDMAQTAQILDTAQTTAQTTDVLISEVGPRDGLQSVDSIMSTSAKIAWIRALAAAGVSEVEVGSFVSAKLIPQLADTAAVVEGCKTIPDMAVAVLIPNLRGAKAAIAAGVKKISLPFSVSETHSQKNLNRSHPQLLQEIAAIRAHIDTLPKPQRPHFEVSLSTAFGCTIEGPITNDFVVAKAEALMAHGADEVGLSDTTGYANPAQVTRLVTQVKASVGDDKLNSIHLHNTRGLGLANALAAFEAGIDTFDSSLGGLGGCPFAPGASGNIVTEDLVFMFEAMGVKTGIDLENLLGVRNILASELPQETVYGFTAEAGLPLGFSGST